MSRGCTSSIFEGGSTWQISAIAAKAYYESRCFAKKWVLGPHSFQLGVSAEWPGPTYALWRTAASSCPARRPGPRRRPPRPLRTTGAQRRGGRGQRPSGPGPSRRPSSRGWPRIPGKGSPPPLTGTSSSSSAMAARRPGTAPAARPRPAAPPSRAGRRCRACPGGGWLHGAAGRGCPNLAMTLIGGWLDRDSGVRKWARECC